MKYFLLFSSVVISAIALPYELIQDEQGLEYYLMPRTRLKRQSTNFNIQSPGIATISHKENIFDDDNHRLDGTAYASKNLHTGGIIPEVYGGRVDYSHKPSGSIIGLQADHIHGLGTDVKASGTWNFVKTRNAEVGLTGYYDRQFGTFGTGKPNIGGGVSAKFIF